MYAEAPPPPELRPWLACTWRSVVASDRPVLPDGCVDIVWAGGRRFVAGPDTGPQHTALPLGTLVLGLRFRPGAAPSGLGLPADELTDRRPDLDAVWGSTASGLAERIGEVADVAPLLAEVRRRLDEAPAPDPVVAALVAGRTDGIDLGPRQLHRRCTAAVGYGPKVLDRVLRFQRFLATTGPLAERAATAGYADQSHLNRECRRLAGTTPAALVA